MGPFYFNSHKSGGKRKFSVNYAFGRREMTVAYFYLLHPRGLISAFCV